MTIKLNYGLLMQLGFSRADIAALTTVITRSGIAENSLTAADNAKQFEEWPVTSLEGIEAKRGVDELRQMQERGQDPAIHELIRMVDELSNEQAATRSEVQALRNRIESLEDRLA